jgi:hypothetical protein
VKCAVLVGAQRANASRLQAIGKKQRRWPREDRSVRLPAPKSVKLNRAGFYEAEDVVRAVVATDEAAGDGYAAAQKREV